MTTQLTLDAIDGIREISERSARSKYINFSHKRRLRVHVEGARGRCTTERPDRPPLPLLLFFCIDRSIVDIIITKTKETQPMTTTNNRSQKKRNNSTAKDTQPKARRYNTSSTGTGTSTSSTSTSTVLVLVPSDSATGGGGTVVVLLTSTSTAVVILVENSYHATKEPKFDSDRHPKP
jgi:hypothetical protein